MIPCTGNEDMDNVPHVRDREVDENSTTPCVRGFWRPFQGRAKLKSSFDTIWMDFWRSMIRVHLNLVLKTQFND